MMTEETDALELTDETAEYVLLWKKSKLYMYCMSALHVACHIKSDCICIEPIYDTVVT